MAFSPNRTDEFWRRPNHAILHDFEQITHRADSSTARTKRYRIAAALHRYERAHGSEPPLIEVVSSAEVLGRILGCDRSLRTGRQLAVGTIKGVRLAFRALIAACPPPPGWTRDGLREVLGEARAATEETVGLRRVVAVGHRRPPAAAHAPSAEQIAAVQRVLSATGQRGSLVAQFLGFLYASGNRPGAVLALRRLDLVELPDGTLWAYMHEKSRNDRRPVYVRPAQAALALAWRALGPEAWLWVAEGRPLTPGVVSEAITSACADADVPRFTPVDLRRAFARDLVPYLGLGGTQRAGGWLARATVELYRDRADPLARIDVARE